VLRNPLERCKAEESMSPRNEVDRKLKNDPAFRQHFLIDPKGALASAGFAVDGVALSTLMNQAAKTSFGSGSVNTNKPGTLVIVTTA
jgi:hypothetical protein